MRTVQAGVESAKFLGKNHHVPIIRFGNERHPFHLRKVSSFGQRDSHSISRVGAIGDEVLIAERRHTRILHAELFIGRERSVWLGNQEWLGVYGKAKSVVTARQPDNRSSGAQMRSKEHDVLALMLHHRRVVNGLYRVGNVGFGENRILTISPYNVALHAASSLRCRKSSHRRVRRPRPWCRWK